MENTISLANIGREAHTYLYHIVNNYENLDDYTLFCQGKPFDHYEDIVNTAKQFLKYKTINDYVPLTDHICYTSSFECPYDPSLPMKEFFEKCFGNKHNGLFRFVAGAQFVASRQVIQKIPIHVWKYLLDTVHFNKGPWVMERFWEMIFLSVLDHPSVPKFLVDNFNT